MFVLGICQFCIIALILTSASALDLCSDPHDGPCKKSSQCSPNVTPANSTHMLVNWENAFKGCQDEHIEKTEIQIKRKVGPTGPSETRTVTVTSQEKTFHVEANPCLRQTIAIILVMKQKYSEDYGRGAIRTPGFQYNSRKNGNYPFGGLLANEVVPSICLKENGTITIPSPPAALSECGVTSGDVKYDKFKEVGQTAKVIIYFKNPENPSQNTIKNFEVMNIQACSVLRAANSISNSIGNTSLVLVFVGFALLVISLIVLLVLYRRRQDNISSREMNKEVDANPVYGIYALNDEGEDVGVTEVRDINEYYAM